MTKLDTISTQERKKTQVPTTCLQEYESSDNPAITYKTFSSSQIMH